MSNPIGWCDKTINPITGCLNGCEYCYARKMAKRQAGRNGYPKDDPFSPTFHFDKLAAIHGLRGKGKRIFLDSMSDWFGPGIEREWVWATIDAVRNKPDHVFLVLTKRPDRISDIIGEMIGHMPANLWFGVSVTCQEDVWRIQQLVSGAWTKNNFVSFEPLHGPISCDLSGIEWVIIGAESGNRKGKIVPDVEWVDDLFFGSRGLPIFMKDNLRPIIGDVRGILQEFPEGMQW
ncbi:MAG: DUF5131 family protein [Bacilli bacterium]|jgi:protein gp37